MEIRWNRPCKSKNKNKFLRFRFLTHGKKGKIRNKLVNINIYWIYTVYIYKSVHHCHTPHPFSLVFHLNRFDPFHISHFEVPFPAPSSNTALPCSIARARDVAKCAMRTTAGGHVESPVGSCESDECLERLSHLSKLTGNKVEHFLGEPFYVLPKS